MRLSEVLSESAISLNLRGEDKWKLLEELTDLLIESDQAPETWRAALVSGLQDRERQSSTGMQDGFAIPHCRMDDPVERTLVSLAILGQGIDFEAIDGRRTHLVVCLVTPRKQNREHLHTLAGIAQLFARAGFRERLLAADSAGAALEVIREEERELG